MPVIATYRHRLVLLEGSVAPLGDEGQPYWLVVAGRTQICGWRSAGDSQREFFTRLLPLTSKNLAEFLEPPHPDDLESAVWNATAGDYPPGSPYDLPRPLLTKEE